MERQLDVSAQSQPVRQRKHGRGAALMALIAILGCLIGCTGSKSSNSKTCWTAVEPHNSNQKGQP
jgi:hypothetical protein